MPRQKQKGSLSLFLSPALARASGPCGQCRSAAVQSTLVYGLTATRLHFCSSHSSTSISANEGCFDPLCSQESSSPSSSPVVRSCQSKGSTLSASRGQTTCSVSLTIQAVRLFQEIDCVRSACTLNLSLVDGRRFAIFHRLNTFRCPFIEGTAPQRL